MSSLSGLKAAPSTAILRADDRTAADLAGQVDHADPSAHVDRVDLPEERQSLVHTQLTGARHEGPDVLGQAAATEPEARR